MGRDSETSCLPGASRGIPGQGEQGICHLAAVSISWGVMGRQVARVGMRDRGRVWVFVGPRVHGSPGVCQVPAWCHERRVLQVGPAPAWQAVCFTSKAPQCPGPVLPAATMQAWTLGRGHN